MTAMRVVLVIAMTSVLARTAHADATFDELCRQMQALSTQRGLDTGPGFGGMKPPRMVIKDAIAVAPKDYESVVGGFSDIASSTAAKVATAADGKAAWIAMDLGFSEQCFGRCARTPTVARAHGLGLFEAGAAGWTPVVWSLARILSAKELAQAKQAPPAAIARTIDPGAEDVVAQLEATLGDPRALAKTVSDRKDVVLYGSELKERYVGGAAARAQLATWKLGFKIRDGVFAGLTTSKTVAWLVANVDAAKAGGKPIATYRMFAIYEKTAAGWQLVQLGFATPPAAAM